MYYRRKLLLALVEAFDKTLLRTDFMKLLFLYCVGRGSNHYDFFPYKYGAFSYLVYYDMRRLSKLGLLETSDDLALSTSESFILQLRTSDRNSLKAFAKEFQSMRGKSLVRKAYLEYPYYATRSEILTDALDEEEIQKSIFWSKADESPCFFTLGYQGLTIDAFLNKLIANNIKALIDVRNNPRSMKYGFSYSTFSSCVESVGITYFHFPDLGVPPDFRQDLKSQADYEELFTWYREEVLSKNQEQLNNIMDIHNQYQRIALVCFEASHRSCHRWELTKQLEQQPQFVDPVVHL